MFERLTADKVYLNSIRFGIQVNFPPHCGHEKAKEVDDFVKNVFDRLAAYEDSGLSPEDILGLKDYGIRYTELEKRYREALKEADDLEQKLDQYNELTKAKAEGRLVVLPCKVGDAVYFAREEYAGGKSIQSNEVFEIKFDARGIVIYGVPKRCSMDFMCYSDDIGKTVFLTREAAEKALGVGE